MKKKILVIAITALLLGENRLSLAQQDPGTMVGSTGSVLVNLKGKKVTYKTVRAEDGKIWLQQNLGSIAVAKSYSHVLGYGDLYTWGRWSDGHELRLGKFLKSGAANPNNPDAFKEGGLKNAYYYTDVSTNWWWAYGNTYDKWEAKDLSGVNAVNGCDPCKEALGEDWRLPTADEYRKIIELENISDIKSAYDSNLKLTAGGYRSLVTGEINGIGHYGRYWTKTAAAKGNAYLLTFNTKEAKVGAIARGGGLSIRCLKN
jgi:uncharacterized protein (TIGR02145 family)